MFRPETLQLSLDSKKSRPAAASMAYSTSTLAEGCFGKVYKQKYNDTWAAIKKVPQQLISRKDLERESAVYHKLNHPNIVKLLGKINLKDGKWIIPLEFIFGEDLETTIFKASKSKIQASPAVRGTIILGMCEGLLHLHAKDIVHQDLKPENIMVEHDTNRAVIIDLGLAKFYRYGLNSAVDMGNEAYSAPEVLQRLSQRDQRSDVWALGKIIAELCERIRLYTPSVCPAKIKEIMHDQPYCNAVCRMVEANPTLRASMGGVISDIRKEAAGAGAAAAPVPVVNTPVQKDYLKPPSSHLNVRNPSPTPVDRGASPVMRDLSPRNRDPTPMNRDPSPRNRDPSPRNRDPTPMNRDPSPRNRDPSPRNRDPSPRNRDPTPMNKIPSPMNRDPSPRNWDPTQMNRDPTPMNRDPTPMNRDPSPRNWDPSPRNWDPTQMNRDPTPMNRDPSPRNRDPSPRNRDPSPRNRDPTPVNKIPSPMNRDQSPMNKIPTPMNRDPTPRNWDPTQMNRDPTPRNRDPTQMNRTEPTQDFLNMKFFQEAAKDLPCNLPTTGRVVVRRFEEKNGEVETWEQKEVVTRDGKIVKFDDIRFNSK
ncbi:dual specificity testis-specific protein kinase 1 [Pseudoliparis swirei]|uniref:dual specificity testis-specific protein kinase 1 n=1 Tax=Pseudoliparis swirei TaxID=2059687 RepID=UPI0024BD90F4|nr:dual specificity testis-specific protein kinase 1 [Pseudoliparis swirei]